MAGKISSKNRQATPEEKRARIEKQYTEWIGNEITILHAFGVFIIAKQGKGCSETTIEGYRRMYLKLDRCLVTMTGSGADTTPVDWLTMNMAQLLFRKSLEDVSEQTVNYYLRHYRAFGNFCEEKGYIEGFTCPMKEVEPPVKEVYTDAELKKLLAKPNKDNFTEYRNYCIVALILATGARSHTIRSLKVKDVDLIEGYINYNTTKSSKVIRLGLEQKIRAELADYIARYRYGEGASNSPLFPSDVLGLLDEEQELSRDGLIKAIAKYNKKRGVEKTSIHLLRHTFAKNWITSGGDIISLARVLTHSELKMVQRYSNLYATDIKEEIVQHSTLSQINRASGKTLRSSTKKN